MRSIPFLSIVTALALIATGVAEAAASSTKTSVDSKFGHRGWARISIPHGVAVSPFDKSKTSCVAGPRDSYFVFSQTMQPRSWAVNGALVEKFTSRGRLDRRFGRRGVVRFRGSRPPESMIALRDGSALLTTAMPAENGVAGWRISRLTPSGRRDTTFGSGGDLTLEAGLPSLTSRPLIVPLSSGRFAVVQRDLSPITAPRSRLLVYSVHGSPEISFGGTGHHDLPWEITSVAPAESGRLLVGGRGGVAKVNADGSPVLEWGAGGVTPFPEMPYMAWSPEFANSKPPTLPAAYYYDEIRVGAGPDSSVLVAAQTEYEVPGTDSNRFGWGARLKPDGSLDTSWGRGGGRYLGANHPAYESESESHWADFGPMPDGRVFAGDFFLDLDDGYHEMTGTVVGGEGTLDARDTRTFKLLRLRVKSFGFDGRGRYLFICGERRDEFVATRVPLT